MYMSREELLQNYEYIATRGVLRKEYPFIKTIIPIKNYEDYEYLKYVDIIVDPFKLLDYIKQEVPNARLYPFFKYIQRDEVNDGYQIFIGLSLLFDTDNTETYNFIRQLKSDIIDKIDMVRESKAIPSDMRIKKGRIDHSGWGISQDDYEKVLKYVSEEQ